MSPASYLPPADEKNAAVRRQDATIAHHNSRLDNRRPFLRWIVVLLILFTIPQLYSSYFKHDACQNGERLKDSNLGKSVSLEAHIMSKCPDARDCLQQLVVPTMERVSDKVDFKLSYIGRLDNKSDEIMCMHGPSECLGNIIELCVARIYPDPKIFLGFTNCMTSNYSQIPDRDLVQYCSLEHGVDFDEVNKCISDEGQGGEMLRQSVLRSQENNVTKSCTVRLAGKIRCIRDGGKWYDCPGGSEVDDLVHDIERLYDETFRLEPKSQ